MLNQFVDYASIPAISPVEPLRRLAVPVVLFSFRFSFSSGLWADWGRNMSRQAGLFVLSSPLVRIRRFDSVSRSRSFLGILPFFFLPLTIVRAGDNILSGGLNVNMIFD
jgi:hypothetical protein